MYVLQCARTGSVREHTISFSALDSANSTRCHSYIGLVKCRVVLLWPTVVMTDWWENQAWGDIYYLVVEWTFFCGSFYVSCPAGSTSN